MNLKKCLVIIILCSKFFFYLSIVSLENFDQKEKKIFHIKVLLDEALIDEKKEWNFISKDDLTIIDPNFPNKKINLRTRNLGVKVQENYFFLDGHRLKERQLIIQPSKGHLSFQGKSYDGIFLLTLLNERQYLINILPLEDYVYSVLRTESWPGWSLEVNKVFAIACRSYAVAMVSRSVNRKNKLPYHIGNTNKYQTYSGIHKSALLKEAVNQTSGIFLSYDNQPVLAMFDCCCGGIIPSRIENFDFAKAPYLARDYPCTFCKDCKIYRWKMELDMKDIENVFKDSIPQGQRLKEFKVIKHDKAGLVEEVLLRASRSSHTVSGKQLYSLFDKIKSYCFNIRRRGSIISIIGNGYGHHLGLCQWGARQMVDDGWDYQSILQFYYPGTKILKLG